MKAGAAQARMALYRDLTPQECAKRGTHSVVDHGAAVLPCQRRRRAVNAGKNPAALPHGDEGDGNCIPKQQGEAPQSPLKSGRPEVDAKDTSAKCPSGLKGVGDPAILSFQRGGSTITSSKNLPSGSGGDGSALARPDPRGTAASAGATTSLPQPESLTPVILLAPQDPFDDSHGQARTGNSTATACADPVDLSTGCTMLAKRDKPEVVRKPSDTSTSEAVKPKTLPRVFKWTDEELAKFHSRRHTPVRGLMQILRGTLKPHQLAQFRAELKQLKQRLENVVQHCEGCAGGQHRPHPTVVLPSVGAYNIRVFIDLMCYDPQRDIWVLAAVCTGTREVMLARLSAKTAKATATAFHLRWSSLRGTPAHLVSDNGPEMIGGETISLAEVSGTVKTTCGAYHSESHGSVENVIRTVRYSMDRSRRDQYVKAPRTVTEIDVYLASLENAMRSELLIGGYSSAQRAWGAWSQHVSMHA